MRAKSMFMTMAALVMLSSFSFVLQSIPSAYAKQEQEKKEPTPTPGGSVTCNMTGIANYCAKPANNGGGSCNIVNGVDGIVGIACTGNGCTGVENCKSGLTAQCGNGPVGTVICQDRGK